MNTSDSAGSMVLLTRLAKVVYRRSTEDLLGMRLRHFVALTYLRDHDLAPQQGMCETLGMDANNLVLLLNEMEDAGHVERRRDPADRRRHLVEITPAGRRALEKAERAQESIEEDLLSELSASERETLHDLLARVLASSGHPAGSGYTQSDAAPAASAAAGA
ncbi:MAG: MarR family winged helix-turn-helix transcriptional regulator [Solirubrobacteraceae bacterium]